MKTKDEPMHHLYHIRDRDQSSGLGFDGYHGITDDVARRKSQHFRLLKKGVHKNRTLQDAFNRNPDGIEFHVAYSGTKEQVLARERLLVPKENHHWNQQKGGGEKRGMSQDEAIKSMNSGSAKTKSLARGIDKSKVTGIGAGALVADAAAASSIAASTVGTGLVTALAINKTIMKDDAALGEDERTARKVGRVSSTVGGASSGLGALGAVAVAGEVGLGVTGVSTGLTAIGGFFGGGALAGFAAVVAIPVAGAAGFCALGYGGMKLYQKFKKKRAKS